MSTLRALVLQALDGIGLYTEDDTKGLMDALGPVLDHAETEIVIRAFRETAQTYGGGATGDPASDLVALHLHLQARLLEHERQGLHELAEDTAHAAWTRHQNGGQP